MTTCNYCGNENYEDRIELEAGEEFCCKGCMSDYFKDKRHKKTKVIRGEGL